MNLRKGDQSHVLHRITPCTQPAMRAGAGAALLRGRRVLHCVVLGTIQVPSTICSNKPLLPLCAGAGNRAAYHHHPSAEIQRKTLETSWLLRERTGQHWWLPATFQCLSRDLEGFKQLLEFGHKAWDTSSVPKRHVSTSELSTEQLLPVPRAAVPCGDGYTGCTF